MGTVRSVFSDVRILDAPMTNALFYSIPPLIILPLAFPANPLIMDVLAMLFMVMQFVFILSCTSKGTFIENWCFIPLIAVVVAMYFSLFYYLVPPKPDKEATPFPFCFGVGIIGMIVMMGFMYRSAGIRGRDKGEQAARRLMNARAKFQAAAKKASANPDPDQRASDLSYILSKARTELSVAVSDSTAHTLNNSAGAMNQVPQGRSILNGAAAKAAAMIAGGKAFFTGGSVTQTKTRASLSSRESSSTGSYATASLRGSDGSNLAIQPQLLPTGGKVKPPAFVSAKKMKRLSNNTAGQFMEKYGELLRPFMENRDDGGFMPEEDFNKLLTFIKNKEAEERAANKKLARDRRDVARAQMAKIIAQMANIKQGTETYEKLSQELIDADREATLYASELTVLRSRESIRASLEAYKKVAQFKPSDQIVPLSQRPGTSKRITVVPRKDPYMDAFNKEYDAALKLIGENIATYANTDEMVAEVMNTQAEYVNDWFRAATNELTNTKDQYAQSEFRKAFPAISDYQAASPKGPVVTAAAKKKAVGDIGGKKIKRAEKELVTMAAMMKRGDSDREIDKFLEEGSMFVDPNDPGSIPDLRDKLKSNQLKKLAEGAKLSAGEVVSYIEDAGGELLPDVKGKYRNRKYDVGAEEGGEEGGE